MSKGDFLARLRREGGRAAIMISTRSTSGCTRGGPHAATDRGLGPESLLLPDADSHQGRAHPLQVRKIPRSAGCGLQEYFRSRVTRARNDSTEALNFVTAHATTRELHDRCITAFVTKCDIFWALLDAVSTATDGARSPSKETS
jgi:hypothetical protein